MKPWQESHLTPVNKQSSNNQILNSTGGYVFPISDLAFIRRYIILGTLNGTYYADEKSMNKKVIDKLNEYRQDPKFIKHLIDLINECNDKNLCFRKTYLIHCLAFALVYSGRLCFFLKKTIKDLFQIPTNMFLTLDAIKHIKGKASLGRRLTRVFTEFYTANPANDLAYKVCKYFNREGWNHKDVIRLTRLVMFVKDTNSPTGWSNVYNVSDESKPVLDYIWTGKVSDNAPNIIKVKEQMKTASINESIEHIKTHKLEREFLQTEHLNSPEIWKALVPNLGTMALIRNLNKISSLGLFNNKEIKNYAVAKITNPKNGAYLHPFSYLLSLLTYKSGYSSKSKMTWSANTFICAALEEAFNESYKYLQPTNAKICLGLDVSGSMNTASPIDSLTYAKLEACIATVMAKVEPNLDIFFFTSTLTQKEKNLFYSIDSALKTMESQIFGQTNIGLLIEKAIKDRINYDAFIIMTDCEINTGYDVYDLLKEYRLKVNKNVKTGVLAFGMNEFSLFPQDTEIKNHLDLPGASADIYQILEKFIKGEI